MRKFISLLKAIKIFYKKENNSKIYGLLNAIGSIL